MDINYLLALQDFRNGPGACLASFFTKMTFLGEVTSVIVIMAIIYWCLNKELGTYFILGWGGNRFVNSFLKVTLCAYRPWIRDGRIIPYGDAMTTATGYSFPSGHTTNGGTIFGGIAVRKDFSKSLRIFAFIGVLLIGFSRNFLGVHTPQDVIVGTLASMLVMWGTFKLMEWLKIHPEKDYLVVCIGIGAIILLAIYAAFKPYPADYGVDGKLIVDGAKMANDTFKAVGWSAAILVGWILERRFVCFSTDISLNQRLTRAVTGILSYYAVAFIFSPLIKDWFKGPAGTMLSCGLQMFYVVFLFPFILKKLEK